MRFPSAIAVALGVVVFGGCSRSPVPHAQDAVARFPASPLAISLSASQLNAIKIGIANTRLFRIEVKTMGSIGFDEAPAVIDAESNLISASAVYKLADKELARIRALRARGGGLSQRDYEQAISNQQSADAAFKAAWYAVRLHGKTDTEIAHIVETGRLDAVSTTEGTTRWVVAQVLESDSTLLHVGQQVTVSVLAYPGHIFEGKLSKIDATVDPQTHRVAVRAKIADLSLPLRPGMLADVEIQVQPPTESVAVPAGGIVREGDGTMTVWITTDGHRFQQRIVKTGLRENGEVQIIAGLPQGKRIVTDGAIFLDNMLQMQSD